MFVATRDAKVTSFTYVGQVAQRMEDHPALPEVEANIGNLLT